MLTKEITLLEAWNRNRREHLKSANQLRIRQSQLTLLLSDSSLRKELQDVSPVSLLPPVGTELFRPFTLKSLEKIEHEKESNTKTAEEDVSQPASELKAGKPLPFIYGKPPPELLNVPLEELDPYYQSQETFIVISKQQIISRFNAGSSFLLLSPLNLIRRNSIFILLHWFFSFLLIAPLLLSCFFMTMKGTDNTLYHLLSWITGIIFTTVCLIELVLKLISRGFCYGKFTYVRDPWNWLDLLVIISVILTEVIGLGRGTPLRTIRVLKIIPLIPGLKTAAGSLVHLVRRLGDAILLIVFSLIMFAVIGQQLFMGSLRQKCMIWPPMQNLTDNDSFIFHEYINKAENYYYLPGQVDPLLCGNFSNSGTCPEGHTCLRGGRNPNYGFTNYDNFLWSFLSTVRLFTKDFWENLAQLTLRAKGKHYIIYHVLVLVLGSFYLLSLVLAILAKTSVKQNQEANTRTKKKEKEHKKLMDLLNTREEAAKDIDKCDDDQRSCSSCWYRFAQAVFTWNCCGCWRKCKLWLRVIVLDPFFDLAIALCLILNALFMAMEHYPLTVEFEIALSEAELVFWGIFTAEVVLKLLATDPYHYFQVGWNIFDSIIVSMILINLVLADVGFLPVCLCRLMWIFKLAKYWPAFKALLKMIGRCLGVLRNQALLLAIVLITFSIAGMQLFGQSYDACVCRIAHDCELPRWHMSDFSHSFMVVFRAVCGEWIETMWDCMEVANKPMCVVFYLLLVVIANLTMWNLFFTLLLISFRGDNMAALDEDRKLNNVQIAVGRICRAVVLMKTWFLTQLRSAVGKKPHPTDTNHTDLEKTEAETLTVVTSDSPSHDVPMATGEADMETPDEDESKCEDKSNGCRTADQPIAVLKKEKDNKDTSPPDCYSPGCYRWCPCLDIDSSQGQGKTWARIRRTCFTIVEHYGFDIFMIFIILLNSGALAFEDIHLQHRHTLKMVLEYADQIFIYIFVVEMILKWVAYGCRTYFTNVWCWLDFLILAVSLISLGANTVGYSELGLFRCLQPLRALSRFKRLRVVVCALGAAVPAIIQALLVGQMMWLIFAILGVNLFAGKFYYCFNETSEEYFTNDIVANRSECLMLIEMNFTEIRWKKIPINFDHIAIGYLALLQVATNKGWMDIMYAATDGRRVEDQPVYEANTSAFLYFVNFIIFGCFFTFTFFTGTLLDNFHQQRAKIGGNIFMTEEQRKFYDKKKLDSKKVAKPLPRPSNKFRGLLFDLVTSRVFSIFIVMVICLHLVTTMVETHDQSMEKEGIIYFIILAIILIYVIECCLKIIALGKHYFTVEWNILDFVVTIMCVLGVFLSDLLEKYFVSPPVFALLRLFHIFRWLHFFRWTKGIQKLLSSLQKSLPAVFNIGLLLLLIMYVFSIFGMSYFGYVNKGAMIDDMTNFETFGNSLLCMFTTTTMAGWDGLLLPTMKTPPDCDPFAENTGSEVMGDCGSPGVGIVFFCSYIMISFLLLFIMFLAVIMENFKVATEENTDKLCQDDLETFFESWEKFDPDASQFIQYSALSDFCDSLQGPLRIPKPNTVKLVSMDLPLASGDRIHWQDLLLALATEVVGDLKGMGALKDDIEKKFMANDSSKVLNEPISSTLRRRQEEVAAYVIQRAYQEHLNGHQGEEGVHGDKPESQREGLTCSQTEEEKEGSPAAVLLHSISPPSPEGRAEGQDESII